MHGEHDDGRAAVRRASAFAGAALAATLAVTLGPQPVGTPLKPGTVASATRSEPTVGVDDQAPLAVTADRGRPIDHTGARLELEVEAPPPAAPDPVSLTEQERAGHAALGLIEYPWHERLPGWTITFGPGRDDVLGFTYSNERRIEIFVRDGQSTELLAHVIAHELGHAVDVDLNSSEEREAWQNARGIGDEPWWPGDGLTDFATGAGDFAESFAAWQVGSQEFRSRLGEPPDAGQRRLMAEMADG